MADLGCGKRLSDYGTSSTIIMRLTLMGFDAVHIFPIALIHHYVWYFANCSLWLSKLFGACSMRNGLGGARRSFVRYEGCTTWCMEVRSVCATQAVKECLGMVKLCTSPHGGYIAQVRLLCASEPMRKTMWRGFWPYKDGYFRLCKLWLGAPLFLRGCKTAKLIVCGLGN